MAKKLFKATIIAALLFQSAAIDTTAQSKKSRRKPPRSTASVKSPPERGAEVTPVASPTPAPAKANSRKAPPDQLSAPSSPINKGAVKATIADTSTAVRYAYEFNQPNFIIRRIVIEHDATGRGNISFARKDSEEPFTDPLEISPPALARITTAWEALKFLDSDANYQADKQFPHLGTMTLRLKQGGRERKAEFNWTHDEGVAALVKEYRSIGEQQLFIFDVAIARQYQPSDTVKIFKRLESLLDRKEISDTTQLVPLLRDLETDERIPLIARNHATRLLKKIEK